MHLGQAFWLIAQVSLVSAVWVMITFWPIAPTGPVVVTVSVWAMFIENVVLRLDSHALPYRPAINPHLPIWTHWSHRLLGPSPDSSPPSVIILPILRVFPLLPLFLCLGSFHRGALLRLSSWTTVTRWSHWHLHPSSSILILVASRLSSPLAFRLVDPTPFMPLGAERRMVNGKCSCDGW